MTYDTFGYNMDMSKKLNHKKLPNKVTFTIFVKYENNKRININRVL